MIKKIPETSHEFFSNVAKTPNISQTPYLIPETSQTDSVLQSIKKFFKHPGIINSKNRMSNSDCTFSLKFETQEKCSKLIQNLNSNKATQQYDIPVWISKRT